MTYTNRTTGRKFIADEYGSVFELHDGAWWFFCKLNGRTLRTAVLDNLKLEVSA